MEVGEQWDLSCPDWELRLRQGRSLVPDLPYLDLVAGNRAVAVFNKLRLFDVPGNPTMEEAAGDWFRDIVRAVFGSYDSKLEWRFIQEVFLLVSKKQTKTTAGALLMLTALLLNVRPYAPFLFTGPVQKTADDGFAAAAGAIELDPVLKKKLHVRDHIKTIIHRETHAKLEIMTFDPKIITGKKVVGALVDEEHELGKMPRAKRAMIQLRGGMIPFPEAFLGIITTQSDEPPAGVFREDLVKARAIRDGTRKGRTLPILYEFPRELQQDREKQPWRDPKLWPMVLPNLGRSIQLPTLIQAFADEEANGEKALRIWASQHLNLEIGLALGSDNWVGAAYWAKQGDETLTYDELLRRCEVVVFGIDGGGLEDLLGFCAGGRERGTGNWLTWHHAWASEIVLERRQEIATRLRNFEEDGELTIYEKPGKDVQDIADLICRAYALGVMPSTRGIAVDAIGIGDTVKELTSERRKIPAEMIVAIKQGYMLNGAILTTERQLAAGTMFHGATQLMEWCVGNAKVVQSGNAILVTKEASGKAKIDPVMATYDAVSLLSMNPVAAPKTASVDDWLKSAA